LPKVFFVGTVPTVFRIMAMLPGATVETTGGKKQATTGVSQRASSFFRAGMEARRQSDRAAVETDDGRLVADGTKTPSGY
jgi:hypothetical protein